MSTYDSVEVKSRNQGLGSFGSSERYTRYPVFPATASHVMSTSPQPTPSAGSLNVCTFAGFASTPL